MVPYPGSNYPPTMSNGMCTPHGKAKLCLGPDCFLPRKFNGIMWIRY